MGETINKLIKFISEDPIMLGLCFAIVALIIIFILVLIFGGKKEKKKEEAVNNTIDNTQALLKTTLDDEPLRSTQEFAFNMGTPETKLENTQGLENIQLLEEKVKEEDVPITVNEAMELKSQREMEALKNTVEMPVVSEAAPLSVEEPVIPSMIEPEPVMPPVMETPEMSTEPKIEQPLSPVYTSLDNKPEMEIPVAPRANRETPALQVQEEQDIDLPKLKTEPTSSIFDTLSGESFNINNNHE